MRKRSVAAVVLVVLATTAAQAAPVYRTVEASMQLTLEGHLGATFELSGTGTVSVDTATGTIRIPAGLVQLTARTIIPLTATTAAMSLSASVMYNQSGTLSLGGATKQLPDEVCPIGLPACVGGGGTGGEMGLAGSFIPYIVLMPVYIPVDLNAMRIGQGGSTNTLLLAVDAAAWTNGTGVVTTPNGTMTRQGTGSIGGSRVTFVTPTSVIGGGDYLRPFYTTLTLDFAPEPGALCLLAAVVAGLAAVARHRRRQGARPDA